MTTVQQALSKYGLSYERFNEICDADSSYKLRFKEICLYPFVGLVREHQANDKVRFNPTGMLIEPLNELSVNLGFKIEKKN